MSQLEGALSHSKQHSPLKLTPKRAAKKKNQEDQSHENDSITSLAGIEIKLPIKKESDFSLPSFSGTIRKICSRKATAEETIGRGQQKPREQSNSQSRLPLIKSEMGYRLQTRLQATNLQEAAVSKGSKESGSEINEKNPDSLMTVQNQGTPALHQSSDYNSLMGRNQSQNRRESWTSQSGFCGGPIGFSFCQEESKREQADKQLLSHSQSHKRKFIKISQLPHSEEDVAEQNIDNSSK